MPLSDAAVQKILGIRGHIPLRSKEMAKDLRVTFFPSEGHRFSPNVQEYADRLRDSLIKTGVTVIPFEETLVHVSSLTWAKRYVKAFLNNCLVAVRSLIGLPETRHYVTLRVLRQLRRGKKIMRGIAVIALGEGDPGNLPMDNVISFSDGNVVTIVDLPEGINEDTSFETHFDVALKLFAHHVTNIIIGVGEDKWILYNFNASHPIYPMSDPLESHLLESLVPKLAAPIRPPRLAEFKIKMHTFDSADEAHAPFIKDLIESGKIFSGTNLYPPGKKIDDLPFRNELYQWIGKVHLDDRNGMSYGFLARQMPVSLPRVWRASDFKNTYPAASDASDFIDVQGTHFVRFDIRGERLVVEIPDVWVLTLRSGSNKTNPHPVKDIVKIGLSKGVMMLETPRGLVLDRQYKPTFDTKVILAHAVGNALFAAIAEHFNPGNHFSSQMTASGMAISHWHGYFHPERIPKGWHVHGERNPTVSCSSPQSAMYAFQGKEEVFTKCIEQNALYLGDVHIEPQHGTNITYDSLKDLGELLSSSPEISTLGSKYLHLYHGASA